MEKGNSILKRLESLDLHSKIVSDFTVRTKSGAAVSLVAIIIAIALLLSELSFYRTVEVIEHMEVDPIRGERMRLNFDVTFPDMPCAVVSLDAMDASGQHQLEVMHNVFKQRLDAEGNAIGESTKEGELKTIKSKDQLLQEKQKAIAKGAGEGEHPGETDCGSCYGAGEEGQCCNTCEDVRAAYRIRGWGFEMKGVVQCDREGFFGDVSEQLTAKEGCNLYGHLEVPKVQGNMHFAPGHSLQHAYSHVHDILSFTYQAFNITHRINSFSFGEYLPGTVNLLDGHTRSISDAVTGMHQYFVKLVPTVYKPLSAKSDEDAIHSFQFSVTEHVRKIDSLGGEASHGLLPGVFFHYELSPMRVRIEEKRRSLGHFLTRVCAIIGGVFTVMGLVDGLVYRVIEGIEKSRRRKGGFGGSLMG